jgi:hypothetical protein
LPFIWEEPLAVLFAATESRMKLTAAKPRRRFYVQEPAAKPLSKVKDVENVKPEMADRMLPAGLKSELGAGY